MVPNCKTNHYDVFCDLGPLGSWNVQNNCEGVLFCVKMSFSKNSSVRNLCKNQFYKITLLHSCFMCFV